MLHSGPTILAEEWVFILIKDAATRAKPGRIMVSAAEIRFADRQPPEALTAWCVLPQASAPGGCPRTSCAALQSKPTDSDTSI